MEKKYIFLLMILVIFICTIFGCYAAHIYEENIDTDGSYKNIGGKSNSIIDKSKIGPIVEEAVRKPIAETTISPNTYDIVKEHEKQDRDRKTIPFEPYTTPSEATQKYKESQTFTYIRHRSSVADVVGEYSFEDYMDKNEKWYTRLLIQHSDEELGTSFYAHSGFYNINGDIYCFDIDGNLIKGLAKDEYDIVYVFDDNTGKLITKYQG